MNPSSNWSLRPNTWKATAMKTRSPRTSAPASSRSGERPRAAAGRGPPPGFSCRPGPPRSVPPPRPRCRPGPPARLRLPRGSALQLDLERQRLLPEGVPHQVAQYLNRRVQELDRPRLGVLAPDRLVVEGGVPVFDGHPLHRGVVVAAPVLLAAGHPHPGVCPQGFLGTSGHLLLSFLEPPLLKYPPAPFESCHESHSMSRRDCRLDGGLATTVYEEFSTGNGERNAQRCPSSSDTTGIDMCKLHRTTLLLLVGSDPRPGGRGRGKRQRPRPPVDPANSHFCSNSWCHG